MNGETMIVRKTSGDDVHRVKRIKREDISARKHTIFRLSPIPRRSSGGASRERLTRESSSSKKMSEGGKANDKLDIEALAVQTAQAAIADSSSPGHSMSECRNSSLAKSQSQEPTVTDTQHGTLSLEFDLDLSSIPSDPDSLRKWIVQKIRYIRDNKSKLIGSTMCENGHRELSNLMNIKTPFSNANLISRNVIEGENSQNESPEEKLIGEKSRRERNKDSNMSGRVNKVTSDSHEPSDPPQKPASPKAESSRQRVKRKSKQSAVIHEQSPKFLFDPDPDPDHSLSSNHDPDVDKEVHDISILFKNVLLPTDHGTSQSNLEASISLKAALADEKVKSKSVIKALRILAADSDTLKHITNFLDLNEEDEHFDTSSQNNNASQPPQGADIGTVAPTQRPSISNHQSNEIIRALNAATALLNEMADTKVYVTPYGNLPPRGGTTNGYGNHKSNGTAGPPALEKPREAHSLDQFQIDALLALANGGSLTDDEDDKTIADPDETNGQSLDQMDLAQADVDITATLQRIISQLMAERNNRRSSDDRHGFSPTASVVDPYGSQSVRDQAALLQSLFSQAGVSINTIIPAAQSHATSQLYAHLSSRARSSTLSGGINPAHAGAYGYAARMNQRMLAKPGIFDQAPYLQSHPLQSLSMSARANIGVAPPRFKTPEEQKKIRSYGFPPLPGSRPGVKK